MGLSVVLGIIQSHNGHIEVNSRPGKGTTFTIYLPVLEAQPQTTADDRRAEGSSPLPKGTEKVVLVDDEELNVIVLEEMLSSLGYQVASFTDSGKALAYCQRSEDVDLVITDRTMPGMTGLELATALHGEKQDLPIIICSGNKEGLEPDKLPGFGLVDLLAKPVVIDALARKVRNALDRG